MVVVIKNKEVDLKFTFNSFKYMEDFDLSAIETIEAKPFKIIPLLETLLLGAVNCDPKQKFTVIDVQNFIEIFVEEGSITDLLEELMTLLQDSRFFKSLQKTTKK